MATPTDDPKGPNGPNGRKGPVLLITRDRALVERVRELLIVERFEVVWVRGASAALEEAVRSEPTVVIVDWALDDEPSCEELVYRLRPRRSGPRVLAVAGRGGRVPVEVSGVRAILARALDAEELVDLVWRHHHEVADARRAD